MLAGGVNRADDLFLHVGFSALQALSHAGASRPFHQQADGLVPAEGAGFVVLRRLDEDPDGLAAEYGLSAEERDALVHRDVVTLHRRGVHALLIRNFAGFLGIDYVEAFRKAGL